jgi:hypothetical protein
MSRFDMTPRYRKKLTMTRLPSESAVCEHCGQAPKKLNKHYMDDGKLEILLEVAKIQQGGHQWVKIQQDSRLIVDEERAYTIQCDAVHACRLNWYGLLESKGVRTGFYKVTQDGHDFLDGRLSVPACIWCRSGKLAACSIEEVTVDKVCPKLSKEYWDRYSTGDQG